MAQGGAHLALFVGQNRSSYRQGADEKAAFDLASYDRRQLIRYAVVTGLGGLPRRKIRPWRAPV